MKHHPFLAVLLAGCSGYSMPPATPAPEAIQQIRDRAEAIQVPLPDYVVYGTTLAAMNCIGWFGSQIARDQKAATLTAELGALGMAAGMAGVIASGPAAPAAAAAMGLAATAISADRGPAGIDPVATYSLVRKVQRAWLSAAGTPTSKAEAYLLVEDFAEKCQLPEIRRAIVDAVSTAPVTVNQPAESFGLGQPARPLLPDITVGNQR